ncbi:conserved hypothetical protein [Ancylobacter novellus DSM 506]|uniref:Uncharacterized protein n=1 Tax=Ancylobacter novellus (strain ATCC 8093 / DSM 506 / JCM 20403 / CCM 1077 / IAM 12100 / NBRC 12443 / NCIMB 10456) TaxID=639283 RepID=D7A3Y4_ANCN5|nr:hypothetical protein [Ancylobacter novellus]ADH91761.1 conserved hypothetical protein [Ancylobacter novellus DSM 506]
MRSIKRQPVRLSGNARLAIILWLIAFGASAAIMIAAASKARAATLERATEVVITLHPTGSWMVAAVILAGIALICSVAAILIARASARPRGGI